MALKSELFVRTRSPVY